MALVQIQTIDEMTNLAGFYRHGAALALSDTTATRNREAGTFGHRENAGERRLRRPNQRAMRAGKMNPARRETIEGGPRGRTEAFLEDLEGWYATRPQARANLFHHRIRRAHIEARPLVQQFGIDIRHGEPAWPVEAVALTRAA